jgi:hypothetical protein
VASKLRVEVSIEGDVREFDCIVQAPSLDVRRAVDAGMGAFNKAFNRSLRQAQREHAERTARGDRAA